MNVVKIIIRFIYFYHILFKSFREIIPRIVIFSYILLKNFDINIKQKKPIRIILTLYCIDF